MPEEAVHWRSDYAPVTTPAIRQIEEYFRPYLLSNPVWADGTCLNLFLHTPLTELVKNSHDSVIAAGRTNDSRIDVRVSIANLPDHWRQFQLSVSDNGTGIRPEIAPLLFRALFSNPESERFGHHQRLGHEMAPSQLAKSGQALRSTRDTDIAGGDGVGLLCIYEALLDIERRVDKFAALVGFFNNLSPALGATFWVQVKYRPIASEI